MDEETPVQVALQHLEQQRQAQAHQEAERAAAELELASLRERAGAEVLDDPGAGQRLSTQMQELRDRIEIATRATAAAKPRVTAAEVAYLSAEADLLEQDAEKSRRQLAAHQARTEKLLAQLEQHEGRFVPKAHLIAAQLPSGLGHAYIDLGEPLRSDVLEDEVALAELRAQVLRELAAGRDPAPMLQTQASIRDGRIRGVEISSLYAPCVWGPDAVVPAPAYLRRAELTTDDRSSLTVACDRGV